ncbi:MAG TPA: lactonase family protein [Rectinemataceae bacterium]|nr:lactonase family protein [Rectinemataceae bacterium]
MPNEKSASRGTRRISAFAGSQTSGRGEGISVFRYDEESSVLKRELLIESGGNPSYVAYRAPPAPPAAPEGRAGDRRSGGILYAVQELDAFEGRSGGGLLAYELEVSAEGGLAARKAASVRTIGTQPCHLALDDERIYVSNYGDGSLSVFRLDAGGLPLEPPLRLAYEGRGPHPLRQERAHVHSVALSPDKAFALVADLGRDKVLAYRVEASPGGLSLGGEATTELPPGSGPRHFAFHPGGRFLYLVEELSNHITVFAWEGETGSLAEIQTVPTLPESFRGENTAADIHISPDGRFLYCSNRGHDSIVGFEIDAAAGLLSRPRHTASGGSHPRNFAIDPRGRYLLVANAKSDGIAHFRIEPVTGALLPTGIVTELGEPMCIVFGQTV